ncbi:MAG: cyanophycin synthetase, partial [Halobacteria archaeon]|nr:cyanophycin synthetase [Halobacteria archaeon]
VVGSPEGEGITYSTRGRQTEGGRNGYQQRVDVTARADYTLEIPLLGKHQARNAAVAVGLLEELNVDTDSVHEGMKRADWAGRFEVVDTKPAVILDAAHNPAGVESVVETLEEEFDWDSLYTVFGVMSDKDIERMARYLSVSDTVYTTAPSTPRAEDAESLKQVFDEHGIETVEAHENVLKSVESALSDATEGDIVLVTGSLFTVGEARRRWTNSGITKTFDSEQEASEALEVSGVPASDTEELAPSG